MYSTGSATLWVLGRQPPPPSPPPGASGHQLVVKGAGLRSPWAQKLPDAPWAPRTPEGKFCPLCTPTLSVNPTLTLTPTPTLRGRRKRGAPRGARAVHSFSTCAYNLFFPLVLFSAPHHYLPLPCGEPVCRGCGIGRQARLRWLSRWRTIATGASPLPL